VKPANLKENRVDRRLASNKSGKRQVVVVVREREGKALPAVFRSESAALGALREAVDAVRISKVFKLRGHAGIPFRAVPRNKHSPVG
jgi:hypothetical protein